MCMACIGRYYANKGTRVKFKYNPTTGTFKSMALDAMKAKGWKPLGQIIEVGSSNMNELYINSYHLMGKGKARVVLASIRRPPSARSTIYADRAYSAAGKTLPGAMAKLGEVGADATAKALAKWKELEAEFGGKSKAVSLRLQSKTMVEKMTKAGVKWHFADAKK